MMKNAFRINSKGEDIVSKDITFYKVKPIDHIIDCKIAPDSPIISDSKYRIVDYDRASDWMKKIGQRAIIQTVARDYKKACMDYFHSAYDSIHFGWNEYDFFLKGERLGSIRCPDLDAYEYIEEYEAVIFEQELIIAPDESYCLYNMEDRLYTCDELRKIAKDLESEDVYANPYEALYALLKCAFLAQDGNCIWCEIA